MDSSERDECRVGEVGRKIQVFAQCCADRRQLGDTEVMQGDSVAFQPTQERDFAGCIEDKARLGDYGSERMQAQALMIGQELDGGGVMRGIASEQRDKKAGINPGGDVRWSSENGHLVKRHWPVGHSSRTRLDSGSPGYACSRRLL
jgi:hypothetical protein